MHTSISPIIFNRLYSVTASVYPKPLLLKHCIYIVALTPDLQKVLIYNIIAFLNHSSTTDLTLYLMLLKESYLRSKALVLYKKSLLTMWCRGRQNSSEVATRISTSADNFGLVRNSPARPIITYLRRNLIPYALGTKTSSG